jgi:hypothetical protein
MKMLTTAMIGVVLVTAGSVKVSGGQVQQPPWTVGQHMPELGHSNPAVPDRTEQQEKSRVNEQQKRLIADTDKLLSLAIDLKAEVDKSGTATMSVDEIKKADEIERLAHSVKQRLKG